MISDKAGMLLGAGSLETIDDCVTWKLVYEETGMLLAAGSIWTLAMDVTILADSPLEIRDTSLPDSIHTSAMSVCDSPVVLVLIPRAFASADQM